MEVPLTVLDFLDRAETVFADREAIVDEPDPPGGGWGRVSYSTLAARARSLAVALDGLGIAAGERVAIMSPNSARFLAALFGVPAFGRVLVPINFRLNRDEVAYIIEHSGASVLLVDAEFADLVADIPVRHRFVLGTESDAELFERTGTPELVSDDEHATATINYTSGTTARPKGVQMTHRNLWLNAVTFGWHLGVTDRDVYLHTLPMFHCNGWGLPFAITGMGARHVIIRKIDGDVILDRVERKRHLPRRRTGGRRRDARRRRGTIRARRGGPGRRTCPHRGGRCTSALTGHRTGRGRARLGVQPDLRPDRDVTAPDREPRAARVRHAR